MKLPGAYPSQIFQYHREELLALLQQAIAAGDYGGGKLIDSSVASTLEEQVADFATLPGVSAGHRASAQSLLYPLSLLKARYDTVSKERDNFLERMVRYLTLLDKDSALIDQLVAAANLRAWVDRQGPLSGAIAFSQDFASSHGAVASDLPLTDPVNGVPYTKPIEDVTFLLKGISGLESQPLRQGIGVPCSVRRLAPVGMRWSYQFDSTEVEDLTGADWAKLSVLEAGPKLHYGGPSVSVLLPSGGSIQGDFAVGGKGIAGNLPVFVKTVFEPRRLSATLQTGAAGEAMAFTPYRLSGDDFLVIDGERSYDRGVDYVVDQYGRFVPKLSETTANKSLTLLFTAMCPAYSCSTNQEQWSPTLFLDGQQADITDETGEPLGLWLKMLKLPETEYVFRVDSIGASDYGVEAVLEIELDRPSFIDGVHLAPFSNFPVRLTRISAEGMSPSSRSLVYDGAALGDTLIDRAMTIRFNRQIVHRLSLTFRQENYTLTEHVVDPEDQLRRDTMVALQATLPFSTRRAHVTPARRISGAQYEFGMRDIRAEVHEASMPADYGVFVCGPFEVAGMPEIVRLTADFSGDVKLYLMDKPFNALGVQVGSSMCADNQHGVEVASGAAFGYTPPAAVAVLSKCQFYVKFVLRDANAVVERFLLEVTN